MGYMLEIEVSKIPYLEGWTSLPQVMPVWLSTPVQVWVSMKFEVMSGDFRSRLTMKVMRVRDTQTTLFQFSVPLSRTIPLSFYVVRETHKAPRRKALLTPIFCARGRFSCHMKGTGNTRSSPSVTMFGTELPSKKWLSLTPHVILPGFG